MKINLVIPETNVNTKVFIVPTWELAQSLPFEAHCTVEAEYGNKVLKGTMVTFAHHVEEFINHPAPCNNTLPLSSYYNHVLETPNKNIVILGPDLDTVGGCAILMGNQPYSREYPKFWEIAGYLDVNGAHHIHKYEQKYQDIFNAYWAWSSENRTPRVSEVTECTESILNHIQVISYILGISYDNTEYIEKGKVWESKQLEIAESLLLEETPEVRVYKSNGIFVNGSYFSPTLNSLANMIVAYYTKDSKITISCSDGTVDCVGIMQELFGNLAGGRRGIAGSPHGQKMTEEDFQNTINAVKNIYNKKHLYGCNRCNYTWESENPSLCPMCNQSPTHEK